MPRKMKVNAERLIEAVESGTRSTEIMTKFGIKTSGQLKALYLDALVEKGQAKGIAGRAGRAGLSGNKTKGIKVNKRGSLVIPQAMVKEMDFNVGDPFTVRKTKSGVSLKKV